MPAQSDNRAKDLQTEELRRTAEIKTEALRTEGRREIFSQAPSPGPDAAIRPRADLGDAARPAAATAQKTALRPFDIEKEQRRTQPVETRTASQEYAFSQAGVPMDITTAYSVRMINERTAQQAASASVRADLERDHRNTSVDAQEPDAEADVMTMPAPLMQPAPPVAPKATNATQASWAKHEQTAFERNLSYVENRLDHGLHNEDRVAIEAAYDADNKPGTVTWRQLDPLSRQDAIAAKEVSKIGNRELFPIRADLLSAWHESRAAAGLPAVANAHAYEIETGNNVEREALMAAMGKLDSVDEKNQFLRHYISEERNLTAQAAGKEAQPLNGRADAVYSTSAWAGMYSEKKASEYVRQSKEWNASAKDLIKESTPESTSLYGDLKASIAERTAIEERMVVMPVELDQSASQSSELVAYANERLYSGITHQARQDAAAGKGNDLGLGAIPKVDNRERFPIRADFMNSFHERRAAAGLQPVNAHAHEIEQNVNIEAIEFHDRLATMTDPAAREAFVTQYLVDEQNGITAAATGATHVESLERDAALNEYRASKTGAVQAVQQVVMAEPAAKLDVKAEEKVAEKVENTSTPAATQQYTTSIRARLQAMRDAQEQQQVVEEQPRPMMSAGFTRH